jgi:16S rRNA (guanine527-N7)-methyltransferase
MNPAERIRRGSEELGFPLSGSAIEALLIYLDELEAWNKRINLTALIDREEIVVYHFLDSLSSLALLDRKLGLTLADLGSGAGFPGMVLQIACPGLRVTLVESSEKKVAFLHHLRGKLALTQMRIENVRIERLVQRFDRLISRAIAPAKIMGLADRLLNAGGELILFSTEGSRERLLSTVAPPWVVLREKTVTLPFVFERRFLFAIGFLPDRDC